MLWKFITTTLRGLLIICLLLLLLQCLGVCVLGLCSHWEDAGIYNMFTYIYFFEAMQKK